MDKLQVNGNKDIEYSSFRFTRTAVIPLGIPTFEDWQQAWEFVGRADGAVRFWRGDLIRFADNEYGEMYTQFINVTGMDYQTLRNDKSVADNIQMYRRRDNLTFDHHQEVAYLEPEEQDKLLDLAEKEGIKSKDFRQVVRDYKRKKERKLLPHVVVDKFKKQVIQGDCLEELKKIKDKSIDMIYVDPPYGVNKAEWDIFKEGELQTFTQSWVLECIRVLKDQSHLFIHFPSQKASWLEDLLLIEFSILPSSRIIWNYRNLVKGRDAKDKFLSTYQPILHYNFGNKDLNFPDDWSDERFDVWTIAVPQSNFKEGHDHPTQKPIELMDRLVKFGSFEGEIVLDPMAGSGTTGVACLRSKRDFILIEKESEYIDLINRRLNESV